MVVGGICECGTRDNAEQMGDRLGGGVRITTD